ncbi:hypothetical protein BBJ28_00004660 [Nothophytophthora sp. Chile5]|nr:hypothetical protein BBJ28_00004660 [Nothophytophthora sp. Chile5]
MGPRSSSTGPRNAPSSGGRGRRRPPGELTEQEIARSIQTSVLRVRVALQLGATQADEVPLSDGVLAFAGALDARLSPTVTSEYDVRVDLLECGLNSWENLVELQRVVTGVQRPRQREDGCEQENLLAGKTTLRHDAKYGEWILALGFTHPSEDLLWTFATSLKLRLRSAGVLSKVLLASHRVVVPLAAAFVEGADGAADLAQFQWEGRHAWSQIVVVPAASSDEIQRINLAPVAFPVDSSSCSPSESILALRYPALVSVVDGMLTANTDITKPIVIILRGIPGSGKSSLGREIEAICQQQGVAFTACSADYFFETPRGYAFDVKKLGVAHNKCKSDFTKAIQSGIPRRRSDDGVERGGLRQHIILVDNTSTQKWEYEPYEEIAKAHGSRVHVMEMECPDVFTAFRMGQRNSHGVPPDKVVSMFLRWELDARALRFTPQFEHTSLIANPLSNGHVGGVSFIGLFLDADSRQKLLEGIPLTHPNNIVEHVTLFYRPSKQYTRDAELGALFTVKGVEVVSDARGQALRVELDDNLPLQIRNKIPHITLSTTEGVSASYSNDLLVDGTATRTILAPPIEFTARVGAALLVQNQRVITTTSPFAVTGVPVNAENGASTMKATPRCTKLFVLYVEESDLVAGTETEEKRDDLVNARLLLQVQIQHHLGSICKAHRLLCVQRSQASSAVSSAELLRGLERHFLLSPLHEVEFDDMMVIPAPQPFQAFEEILLKTQTANGSGQINRLSMLTTSLEPLQWPLRGVEMLQNAAVNVIRVGHPDDAIRTNAALAPPCSTISSILDLLRINIQEETRSEVFRGMRVVGDAVAHVVEMDSAAWQRSVRRVDSTLLGLGSDVIELCLMLPCTVDSSAVEPLQRKLKMAMQARETVRHVANSRHPCQFYFRLCTLSSYTPVFCVRMLNPSPVDNKAEDAITLAQMEFCETQQQTLRGVCDNECYTVLVALLRAILRGRCTFLPSECRLSSLVSLLSEHLTLRYLEYVASSSEVDVRPSAGDIASGRIIHELYSMLAYLAKWDEEDWLAAFGGLLRPLLGDNTTQLAWQRAMIRAMRDCEAVLDRYGCARERSVGFSPPNPAGHLAVLAALIYPDKAVSIATDVENDDSAATIAPVRTYIELPTRCQWDLLYSHALCDQLREAALAVAAQDEFRTRPGHCFFHCAPSQVARRVDIVTPSLELLRAVIHHLSESDPAQSDVEAEGDEDCVFLPSGFVVRHASSDEDVLLA